MWEPGAPPPLVSAQEKTTRLTDDKLVVEQKLFAV
jgi:hypothetical protein